MRWVSDSSLGHGHGEFLIGSTITTVSMAHSTVDEARNANTTDSGSEPPANPAPAGIDAVMAAAGGPDF